MGVHKFTRAIISTLERGWRTINATCPLYMKPYEASSPTDSNMALHSATSIQSCHAHLNRFMWLPELEERAIAALIQESEGTQQPRRAPRAGRRAVKRLELIKSIDVQALERLGGPGTECSICRHFSSLPPLKAALDFHRSLAQQPESKEPQARLEWFKRVVVCC